jgi:hypothetical protein
LREELADRGYTTRTTAWCEAAHLDRYSSIIEGSRAGRSATTPHSSLARRRVADSLS